MPLTKKSIAGLGSAVSLVSIGATVLLTLFPLNTNTEKSELSELRSQTETQNTRITELSSNSYNIDELQSFVNNFTQIVPQQPDLEGLSRAISSSVNEGVTIVAFNFGAPEEVAEIKEPSPLLEQFTPPFDLSSTTDPTAESEEGEDKKAVKDTNFQRIPVSITVNVSDYRSLSVFLNNLENQNRLIYVQSFSTTSDVSTSDDGTSVGGIQANIYAYAYVYN